jgi:hypothetical protein
VRGEAEAPANLPEGARAGPELKPR